MKMRFYFVLAGFLLFAASVNAQTDTKQQQLEEMRKIKKQMQDEQKTIQQQQEWNNQSSQQEIKKLNQENQQKNFEIQTSKQEAQTARQEAQKAKIELENKKIELAVTQVKIDSAKKLLASTEAMLQTSEMTVKRTAEALLHQEDSVKLLNEESKLQSLKLKNEEVELDKQKIKNRLSYIVIVMALGLALVLGALFVTRQKSIRILGEKNRIIAEEKKRSDDLLLNILPEEVMNELKAHGKTQARNYHKATVLFADIKDFTTISEQLTPDELIEALDAYFERFDKVIEKYNIEKIKTIGDAYVCAGGIPTKDEDNPQLVVQAAVDFVREIENLRRERTKVGKAAFDFRIGIHTGNLIAGVIGIRKFAYDIWGDTVNMAARMQQAGEPNKVNISGATYEIVKDKFSCVYRGKHEVKNKGETDMYFVEKAILN